MFDLRSFEKYLKPDAFLSGLALGYKVLYDEADANQIRRFLEKLVKEGNILYNRHETWDLKLFDKLTLKRS